ncbi:hypothetical protein SO802_001803 [Lithocarpus litseifolius]|uniref:Uncharacterized protein n=1 Tax=Lithocarpus litseifolius TaxID=425828 RepID=A0AAW2DX69_9ROSI
MPLSCHVHHTSEVSDVKDDYRKEVFSIAAWLLWNRRNAIHFGRPVRPTAQLLSTAGNLLQDFLAVQQIDTASPPPHIMHHWSTPDSNYHKINFNAAMFRDSHLAGIGGVVVRDWRGIKRPLKMDNPNLKITAS